LKPAAFLYIADLGIAFGKGALFRPGRAYVYPIMKGVKTVELNRDEVEGRIIDLFNTLQMEWGEDTEVYRNCLAQLEDTALFPGNLKIFMRLLADQTIEIRSHFYEVILIRRRNAVGSLRAIEKHLKWSMAQDRKTTRAALRGVQDPKALTAFFRIVSFTDHTVLARELIAHIRQFPPEVLKEPILHALKQPDESLQVFALHLCRRLKYEPLLPRLLKFYLQAEDKGAERLSHMARRAILETLNEDSVPLVTGWMRDADAKMRVLGVKASLHLRSRRTVGDLVRLVLVDHHTRTEAATVLLNFANHGLIDFDPASASSEEVAQVITKAKREPLLKLLTLFLQDDNPVIREIALYFLCLMPNLESDIVQRVQNMANGDQVAAARIAALRLLKVCGKDVVYPILTDILTDPTRGLLQKEILKAAENIFEEIVPPENLEEAWEEIEQRRRKREQVRSRFEMDAESWRVELD
jgi:hypothetical protein